MGAGQARAGASDAQEAVYIEPLTARGYVAALQTDQLLLDSGMNAATVCTSLHLHPNTLKRWVKAFASGGEEALLRFNYTGSDGWMDEGQLEQFTTWLDSAVRSTAEACAWVKQQFGLDYTDSGMRKLLKRLDYRYKQPTPVPAKADVEAQAAWVATYTEKRGP
jgi:transposase